MKFKELKNGEVFMCSGSEYVKISNKGAIRISPVVVPFSSEEVIAKSKQTSTTIKNWKWANVGMKLQDV